MQKLSIDLKTQLFALLVGFAFVAAFLLGVGVTNSAAAADLDPRPQLERMIADRVDNELQAIDARLTGDTNSDKSPVSAAESKDSDSRRADGADGRDARSIGRLITLEPHQTLKKSTACIHACAVAVVANESGEAECELLRDDRE